MALPPLELFSLRRELPCCRVALSVFEVIFAVGLLANIPPPFPAKPSPLPSSTATIQSERHPADVAQLVEQLIRNQQVVSSSLTVGSMEQESGCCTMGAAGCGENDTEGRWNHGREAAVPSPFAFLALSRLIRATLRARSGCASPSAVESSSASVRRGQTSHQREIDPHFFGYLGDEDARILQAPLNVGNHEVRFSREVRSVDMKLHGDR